MDFKGRPFGPISNLLAVAEYHHKSAYTIYLSLIVAASGYTFLQT
ncbi:MAG: hypothetical protein IPO94_01560 [Saprospiraceae bacterium]|nr:hypothetical protein [Saprospiraceae bacterium]